MVFPSVDIWSPSFWLQPNQTWDDLERVVGKYHNERFYQDLVYPLTLAFALLLLRYLLKRYLFLPTGVSRGVKDRNEKAERNALLEAAYKKSSSINKNKVVSLAKQTDWSEEQVRRWWRVRYIEDQPSHLDKFCESAWDCTYYTYNFIYGVVILWDKPWVWDSEQCYIGLPHQVTDGVWWYYLVSMAFYWSLTIALLQDPNHKDFWQVLLHHLAAIMLLTISRISNLQRLGTLVLVLHDCADIYLEIALMAKYTNYQKLCDTIFGFYTIVWLITRLYIFPVYIVLRLLSDLPLVRFPALDVVTGLCVLLIALHIFWTWRILQVVNRTFFTKENNDVGSQDSKSGHQAINSSIDDELKFDETFRKLE